MDENPNCSMVGIIDDSSNKIEHNFMFLNDKTSNRFVDRTASMMIDNQNNHSNTFMGFQQTPNKFEASQQNLFDPAANHSSLSALFPSNSNMYQRKLFKSNHAHENSIAKKPETPVESSPKFEVTPAVQPFVKTPVTSERQYTPQPALYPQGEPKIHHDFAIQDMDEEYKTEFEQSKLSINPDVKNDDYCSLPHPSQFFGIKDINMFEDKTRKTGTGKSPLKYKLKSSLKSKSKKSKTKRKRDKKKCGPTMMSAIPGNTNFDTGYLNLFNPISNENAIPQINPYFH